MKRKRITFYLPAPSPHGGGSILSCGKEKDNTMGTLKTLKAIYYRGTFSATAVIARTIAGRCESGLLAGFQGSAFLARFHSYLANYLDDPRLVQAAIDHTSLIGIPKREYLTVCADLSQEHLEQCGLLQMIRE